MSMIFTLNIQVAFNPKPIDRNITTSFKFHLFPISAAVGLAGEGMSWPWKMNGLSTVPLFPYASWLSSIHSRFPTLCPCCTMNGSPHPLLIDSKFNTGVAVYVVVIGNCWPNWKAPTHKIALSRTGTLLEGIQLLNENGLDPNAFLQAFISKYCYSAKKFMNTIPLERCNTRKEPVFR